MAIFHKCANLWEAISYQTKGCGISLMHALLENYELISLRLSLTLRKIFSLTLVVYSIPSLFDFI